MLVTFPVFAASGRPWLLRDPFFQGDHICTVFFCHLQASGPRGLLRHIFCLVSDVTFVTFPVFMWPLGGPGGSEIIFSRVTTSVRYFFAISRHQGREGFYDLDFA